MHSGLKKARAGSGCSSVTWLSSQKVLSRMALVLTRKRTVPTWEIGRTISKMDGAERPLPIRASTWVNGETT